ncbi:unnamed protein product, partial [Polarella glacialis]
KEVVSLFGDCYSDNPIERPKGKPAKDRQGSAEEDSVKGDPTTTTAAPTTTTIAAPTTATTTTTDLQLKKDIAFYKKLFDSAVFAERSSACPPGRHLSPPAFHEMLTAAQAKQDVVLFDARNVYETNIGSFSAP